ncbi:alpha/beta fold hydrolase [Virgisporangium aurantiacum]|uniref:alpha/beta fold hydrolase n=1 Tax=Virgisporangium aurantiacum TaxID=175570 RepID=UPI00194EE31E|nr:alpha/beta hydrolase [Virgisporangium aurantiacum]
MGDGYRVRVNGVDLFVRRRGDPALPPLIVVHGGPTWDHSYLTPAVERLSDVAHVVMFDLRGCGRSIRVRPLGTLAVDGLRPHLLADDVAGLVDHVGAERADVLGFSYGGMIAMRTVDRHPDRVRRLILASTTAYRGGWSAELDADPEYHRRRDLREPVRFDDPALVGPNAPDGALSRAMAHASAPRDVWRLDRLGDWDRVLDAVRFSSDWNAPFLAGDLPPAAPDDPPEVLRRWGGPVLIAHGVHDMTFPRSLADRLHAEVPGSVLAPISDAAHMAHFDNPAAWLTAIRTFLTSPGH